MKLLKQALAVLATVVVIAVIAAVVTPKTAHAIVATAVQVVNTAAAPALVSNIDNPGRIPYQSIVDQTGRCNPGGNACFWEFGNPPAGHRIVIQHVSGTVGFSATPIGVSVLLNNGSGLALSTFFAPILNSLRFTTFDQPVQAYFDPSNIIEVQVGILGATFPNPADSFSEVITLTGYELDCSAAPCPAIAH
jgi:hypothetical protein